MAPMALDGARGSAVAMSKQSEEMAIW
jgi:hypothetical protein